MAKTKVNKKTIITITVILVAVVAILLVLIPIENKRKFYEKWGKLAVLAETDERARFITENEELYPKELLAMYYSYEDNFDYVYNYAFHKDDYQSMSFTEEELKCDSIPAFYMDDYRWCYETIGGRYIYTGGCAVVSISMVYVGLTGDGYYDPVRVSRKAEELDASGFLGGVRNSEIGNICEAIGLKYTGYNFDVTEEGSGAPDEAQMKEILDKGRPLILNMKGDTFGSHALVVRGYDETGFIINDPADPEKSARTWTFDELAPEILRYWEIWKE